MSTTEPIADPTTDYDIFAPDFVARPLPGLRGHPVAVPGGPHRAPRGLVDADHLRGPPRHRPRRRHVQLERHPRVPAAGAARRRSPYADVEAPPISSDPPVHQWARKLVLPFFSPGRGAPLRGRHAGAVPPPHRRLHRHRVGPTWRGDYAQQIPVRVIAAMLGVDDSRSDEFVGWVRAILEQGHLEPRSASRPAPRCSTSSPSRSPIAGRNPRENDLITQLVQAEVDGEPVPDDHILGTCNLMLVAGIDTTWSAIGSSLWHLAQHPEHRAQLRDDPDLWPSAIEELLRAYSPVTMARIVAEDTEYAGCPMQAGDRVLMPFPAANRDPSRVRGPRRGAPRPRGEPAPRLRVGHPPLRRVEPGPPRAAGVAPGVPRAHPRVRAGRSRAP